MPPKVKKSLSPSNGYLFGLLLLIVTVGLPYWFLPQYRRTIENRLRDARKVIDDCAAMTKSQSMMQMTYTNIYGGAAENLLGVTYPSSAQIYDRLSASARSLRRGSPLMLNLSRGGTVGSADPMAPVLNFLYPGVRMELFTLNIQGPLTDVIDYLRREVETQAFYLYGSATVSLGASGDWPRYQIQVWLPVGSV